MPDPTLIPSTRLRGNVMPVFTLKKGNAAAVSYAQDLQGYDFTPAPKDEKDLTFGEAQNGAGVDWTLKIKGIVSFDASSLYMYLLTNAGVALGIVAAPKGNAQPSATSPHFGGTVTAKLPPGFGNEARTTPEGSQFECDLTWDGPLVPITS